MQSRSVRSAGSRYSYRERRCPMHGDDGAAQETRLPAIRTRGRHLRCVIKGAGAVGTRWFRQAGGMALNLLSAVSGRYPSFVERESNAVWHAQQAGVREIARRLGRAPSTTSRELRRNASTRTWRLDYRASAAQWHAERRARRPKVSKLATDKRLRDYVQDRLGGLVIRPDGVPVPGPGGPRWWGPCTRTGRCIRPVRDLNAQAPAGQGGALFRRCRAFPRARRQSSRRSRTRMPRPPLFPCSVRERRQRAACLVA
jgi:Helix-turn-helix domain